MLQLPFSTEHSQFFAGLWKEASGQDGLAGFNPSDFGHLKAICDQLYLHKVAALAAWHNADILSKTASYHNLEAVRQQADFVEATVEHLAKLAMDYGTATLTQQMPGSLLEAQEQQGEGVLADPQAQAAAPADPQAQAAPQAPAIEDPAYRRSE